MPGKAVEDGVNRHNSMERLIQVVLDAWSEQGHAALSTRTLAQAAGLPVSSLYHHFGSLDQLYLSVQEHARSEAERWCAVRLDEIAGADLSPAAFSGLLATLIDEWSHGQRRLALAWRECHILAARDERYLPAIEAWRQLWLGFCNAITARCGLGAHGEITSLFFDGESLLHLMRWRRTADRAALDEMCAGWACWLGGDLTPEGPWRRFAREEALRSAPLVPIPSGIAEDIATAAADIVERRGMAGLTHRAVAAEAGLTLGVVSHNFRTSADLARIAFEMIYRRVTAGKNVQAVAVVDLEPEALTAHHVVPVQMLALDELLLAVVREVEFAPFAPQLRYLRGRSSGTALKSLLGMSTPPSPLDAALFSSFLSGMKRACIGKNADETVAYARHIIDPLRHILGAFRVG